MVNDLYLMYATSMVELDDGSKSGHVKSRSSYLVIEDTSLSATICMRCLSMARRQENCCLGADIH